MPSESQRGKSDSAEAGPGLGRSSARVASAWGAARDALASVHNLETLLRNSQVGGSTIAGLLPELRTSASVLRETFHRSQNDDVPTFAVAEDGTRGVLALDALLDTVRPAMTGRKDLAGRASALTDALEAAVDLLALLDRASAPVATEVSLDLIAREAGRIAASARGREVVLLFDEATPDCVVETDPAILAPLLSLVVARMHAAGAERRLVLRARAAPTPEFRVELAGKDDAALPALSVRVLTWAPSFELAAHRVAEQLGAVLEAGPDRARIALGRPAIDKGPAP